MTRDEITAGLSEILEEIAGVAPADVADDKSFTQDLHLDSLSIVELAVASEERFAVKISDADMGNLKTVGDVVSFILLKGPRVLQRTGHALND